MLVVSWDQKISKTRIKPHLYNYNLFGRVAIKKLLVTSNSNLLQMQFARCYWKIQWNRVLKSDETKIKPEVVWA